MPTSASPAPATSRRHSRKQLNEDDVDGRRARGEISCAECRRLKLKCDKKLPCSSCIRRGCPSICPNGSLASGQGTRFVLADTSQLHNKIAEMGQRIRQLEDALAIFQSGVSNETHPLLRDELLTIKFGPETNHVIDKPNTIFRDHSVDSIDALGTLTIGDRGDAKYFGRSAGSETLLFAGADMEVPTGEDDDATCIPAEIARLSCMMPLGVETTCVDKCIDLLAKQLPDQPRASSLCETYMEHGTWGFHPVTRDELINDIFIPIYKWVKERNEPGYEGSCMAYGISPHKLAVLYIVFALGALVDLTLPPYNTDAQNFSHLSRAALSLRPIFESPEISTVQAICLIAVFTNLMGRRSAPDSTWSILSLSAKLAHSLGLHRDSARWNMDAKTVQRRRILFYEIFCAETSTSLGLGRPPCIRASYIDCEIPEEEEALVDENGDPVMGYFEWKYNFCKNILSRILELTLSAEPPTYQTILDLDRKVREFRLPSHLNMFINLEDKGYTPNTYMKGCLLAQFRTVALLYIHRSFFAQAMLDHPVNPLRSPYAPSFLAAYRCASGVIKATLNHYDRFPELCCRWWNMWTHLFSATIIVGSIVTRSPSSSMAPNAFIELGLACDLFEKAAAHSRRARNAIGILGRLREKAFQVYSQFRTGNPVPPPSFVSVGRDYGDDELALFGGQTRVIFSKILSRHRTSRSVSVTTPNTSSPVSSSGSSHTQSPRDSEQDDSPSTHDTTPLESIPDVHPSLVEYLSLLPPAQHPTDSHTATYDYTSPDSTFRQDLTFFAQHYANVHGEVQHSVIQSAPTNNASTNSAPTSGMPFFGEPSAFVGGNGFANYMYDLEAEPSADGMAHIGMMASGDSGIDQQWRNLLQESGLFDQNGLGTNGSD